MAIRVANRKDVKHIVSLNRKLNEYKEILNDYYLPKPNSEKTVSNYLAVALNYVVTSENEVLFVAEENGRIVGYIAGSIEDRAPVYRVERRGDILMAFVLDEYRGHGIGRELTERIIQWFKEKGIEYVELSVDSRNDLGYNVWNSLGFENFRFRMIKRI